MPVLNEAAAIESALRALQPLRGRGHEVIVVDGGSATGRWGSRGRSPTRSWLLRAGVPRK